MVLDVHGNEERYKSWKEHTLKYGIEGLTKINSKIVIDYILDMETGQNIARGSKKGGRSFVRLNSLRVRIVQTLKMFQDRNVKNITKLTENKAIQLFSDIKKGIIKRQDGKEYTNSRDHVKDFKSFWHWLIKVNKKKNIVIEDITEDLDTTKEENSFVYFSFKELEILMPYFSKEEQTRMLFMFDTIIRSPTELMNVKLSDLALDLSELTIREETAKTYGRTIKLLLCKDSLRDYLKSKKLKQDDYLFSFSPPLFNLKLKRVAKEVFEDRMTKGGKPFSQLTQYDFRHSGACHWRKGAYQSKIDALMYRGGWSNLQMLNYYTKKIGMKDSIEKEDLLIEIDKNKLEDQIEILKKRLDDWEKNAPLIKQSMKEGLEFNQTIKRVIDKAIQT